VSKGHNLNPSDRFHFKIVAPFRADVPQTLGRVSVDKRTHRDLVFGTQLLRGNVYRECGPIAMQLLADGRHYQAIDAQSWHVLLEDGIGRLVGCARYRPVAGGFEQLNASQSAIAHSHRYGPLLRSAIEKQIAYARNNNMPYCEVGAWALRPEVRCSTAAVNVALMTYALTLHLGGGIGITTATRLHHSASILRRLGGRRLADLPAYYEPKYGSVIEVLYFNSGHLNPRYADRLEKLRREIEDVPVICAANAPGAIHEELPAYVPQASYYLGNAPGMQRSQPPRVAIH